MKQTYKHKDLERGLGYGFADQALLLRALTPPAAGLPEDNQRLEFLGDAILQLCVSKLIFDIHPTWREGAMSKLRGMLVCTDSLRAWAEELGIVLHYGPRSAKKAVRGSLSGKPLADTMEALLAAVYLDAESQGHSGLEAAAAMVERRFAPLVRQAYDGIWMAKDAKTTLQEWVAARGLPPPVYELLRKSGPDHAPHFFVKVQVGTAVETFGEASTLKSAQTEAARTALQQLEAQLPSL